MRRFGFVLAFVVVGCGSSSSESSGASANDITTTRDAGTDADTRACIPCAERFADGMAKYEAARRQCFCADSVCHEACASTQCTRVPLAADATCNACIDSSYDKCVQVVEAACEADDGCKQYVVCKIDSACEPAK